MSRAVGLGIISREVFKYLTLIVTAFLNINFLIKRNKTNLLAEDIDQYDFMVNSFFITASFCQIMILLEQVLASFLVKTVISDHLYHRDKMSYVYDALEIEEIRKEVTAQGTKSGRNWREMNENDVNTLS